MNVAVHYVATYTGSITDECAAWTAANELLVTTARHIRGEKSHRDLV